MSQNYYNNNISFLIIVNFLKITLWVFFISDYAIPGTPATDGARCHFRYESYSGKHGSFNTPRHPSNYPDNTSCVYEFRGSENEQVRITFENFKVDGQRDKYANVLVLQILKFCKDIFHYSNEITCNIRQTRCQI